MLKFLQCTILVYPFKAAEEAVSIKKEQSLQLCHYLQLGKLDCVCNLRQFTAALPLLKGNSYSVRASDIIAFSKIRNGQRKHSAK